MKKVFVLGLILLLIVVLCSACGKTETEVLTEDDLPDEEIQEEVQEEVVSEATQEEAEVTGNGEDPLYLLSTTWEIANENGGVFLLRGGNLYTLGSYYVKNPNVDYPPGATRTYGLATFYERSEKKEYGDHSIGDVPIPLLNGDDKIVAISKASVPVLKLFPVELSDGYSFLLIMGGGYVGIHNVWDKNDHVGIPEDAFEKAEITDSNGNTYNAMECLNELKKDQVYTLSWFQGTVLNQKEVKADCRAFYWNGYNSDCYEIEGTVTTEGYAEYDVSSIPPGVYMTYIDLVYSGGLIEIR